MSQSGLVFALWLVSMVPAHAALEFGGERVRITIGDNGLPIQWLACAENCADAAGLTRELLGPAGNRLAWRVPGDDRATEQLRALRYRLVASDEGDLSRVTATALGDGSGPVIEHRYAVTGDGELVDMTLTVPAGAELVLEAGQAFAPEPLPGFGALYGKVRGVIVNDAGQATLEAGEAGTGVERSLAVGEWTGLRNRFWSLLLRVDSDAILRVELPAPNLPRLVLVPGAGQSDLTLKVYGGPVEWQRLKSADPALPGMLFAALWDFLRALCFGMLWLLNALQALVGSAGLAIVLLSLAVKILMWPLTRVADRWQDDVNRTASLLKPDLDRVKAEFKGEEAHNRTLAVYKAHGVSPMYTVKSLAGFLIQIPVFIAAFDMLGENFGLHQAGFLWIEDLAKPDRLAELPWVLPFFGGHLNLLPFLMTGVTLLTSMIQTEASLTADLQQQQRLRLVLMAAAFFVLFYTFPAGMVLYWTANNVLHLVKVLIGRGRDARRSVTG